MVQKQIVLKISALILLAISIDQALAHPYGYVPIYNGTGGLNGATKTVVALYRPKNSPFRDGHRFVFPPPMHEYQLLVGRGNYILWAHNANHRLFLVDVLNMDQIFRRDPNSRIVVAKPTGLQRYAIIIHSKFGIHEYRQGRFLGWNGAR